MKLRKRHWPTVRVVTWNVHHGTSPQQLERDLARVEVAAGRPDVFLLQEFKLSKGHHKVFKAAGYEIRYFEPEFAVAWKPERFDFVSLHEWEGDHEYWADPRSLTVLLHDRKAGRHVRFTTYHPPAHVQRKDHGKWPNIWKALAETDRMWDRKAERSAEANIPYISGGDDNVDEERGWFPAFLRRMVRGAARQVRAPEPTHHNRRIDDFRINRLVKVEAGSKVVVKGLHSDHDAFACTFRYI